MNYSLADMGLKIVFTIFFFKIYTVYSKELTRKIMYCLEPDYLVIIKY